MLTRLKPLIHLFLFLLIGLCPLTHLTSCTDVPATNPYDPNTPEVQQVKGSIKGRVYLPQTDQDLSVFDTSKVLLYPLSFPLSNASRCQTDDFQRALRSSDLSPLEERVATFDFTDVQSNEYLMVVCVLGYEALFELVQVQRGQETNHTFTLSVPNEEVIDSGVVGTLRLEGQDMEYGSVRIETVGRPFSALSTSDGQFRLSIPPGTYSLKFTIVGFQTLILADVNVSSQSYNELEEVVLQKDLSASVSGQLTTSIEGFEWTSRSFITLVGDTETRQEIPNRLGEFEFNLLQPGVYTLDVFAEGHLIFNKTLLLINFFPLAILTIANSKFAANKINFLSNTFNQWESQTYGELLVDRCKASSGKSLYQNKLNATTYANIRILNENTKAIFEKYKNSHTFKSIKELDSKSNYLNKVDNEFKQRFRTCEIIKEIKDLTKSFRNNSGIVVPPYIINLRDILENHTLFFVEKHDGNLTIGSPRIAYEFNNRLFLLTGLSYRELSSKSSGLFNSQLRKLFLERDESAFLRINKKYPMYKYLITEKKHALNFEKIAITKNFVLYKIN